MDRLPYTALLHTRVTLGTTEVRGRTSITVSWGDKTLPVNADRRVRNRLLQNLPEEPRMATLYPRTDHEGVLSPRTMLKLLISSEHPEDFRIVGGLAEVDTDNARFVVIIRPNEVNSRLMRPFPLTVYGSLELLESLPERGWGVDVKGVLRPRSLRLMAKEARKVKLPKSRPSKPKDEEKPDGL